MGMILEPQNRASCDYSGNLLEWRNRFPFPPTNSLCTRVIVRVLCILSDCSRAYSSFVDEMIPSADPSGDGESWLNLVDFERIFSAVTDPESAKVLVHLSALLLLSLKHVCADGRPITVAELSPIRWKRGISPKEKQHGVGSPAEIPQSEDRPCSYPSFFCACTDDAEVGGNRFRERIPFTNSL